MHSPAPVEDKVHLRLILVSGKTREFDFDASASAGDVAKYLFENWPQEWAEEAVSKADILRLIFHGRFLHSNVTLESLGLPRNKTVVMHLVSRENLPEPSSSDQELKNKGRETRCCQCGACCIM